MRFEWDTRKNEINIQRHHIDFADIPSIFEYPTVTRLDESIDYGEDRWITIGWMDPLTVVVVWTEREPDVIRIISARKANKREKQYYAAYLSNRLETSGFHDG